MDILSSRHEGCNAKLEDDGRNHLIPVCMGGVALVGCNNPGECSKLFGERINDPSHAYAVHLSEEKDKVIGITRVAREPLIPVLPPTPKP